MAALLPLLVASVTAVLFSYVFNGSDSLFHFTQMDPWTLVAMNHIIPVCTHYQSKFIKNVQGMKDVFSADKADRLSARNMKLIEEIAERTEKIEQLVEDLTEARRIANRVENIHQRAIQYHDTVCPKMEDIRTEIDKLELIVEDGLWTLPKYRELLFIR